MAPWKPGGTMSTPGKRAYRRSKGRPTWRIIRYADDFVILVHGSREDTEALREDVADKLAPLGLRLSAAKTQVVHMSDGFDFLGFRIRWKRQRGSKQWYVYTFIADRPVRSVKAKIRALTHKTSQWDLAYLLTRLGRSSADGPTTSNTPWRNRPSANWTPSPGGGLSTCCGPATAGTGVSSAPPDHSHRAVVDGRGRGRVLPDRGRNRFSLRLPRYPDPYPLATHESRLTAATVEARCQKLARRVRRAARGTRPWQHRHCAPGRLDRCPFFRQEPNVFGHLAEGTPNVGCIGEGCQVAWRRRDHCRAHRALLPVWAPPGSHPSTALIGGNRSMAGRQRHQSPRPATNRRNPARNATGPLERTPRRHIARFPPIRQATRGLTNGRQHTSHLVACTASIRTKQLVNVRTGPAAPGR